MINYSNLTENIGDLKDEEVMQQVNAFKESNPTDREVCDFIKAAQEGMAVVGDRFERGEYFVGDLIFAGELLSDVLDIIKPLIVGEVKNNVTGKIVLGTVKGVLHDIGKNIFKMMATAEGFEVYDIGIDQPVEAFIRKVNEVKPDILGLSGVLTLAIDSMKNTVDGIEKAGLRKDLKIIVGGNPVTKESSDYIGSDAYTTSAAEGLAICKQWIKEK